MARFGGRLPFLLKVLAAETALSIQVHPSRQQAEAGFLAENERGLAPGLQVPQLRRRLAQARDSVRADLLFEALAGMRSPQDAAALLKELGVGQLDQVTAILAAACAPGASPRRSPASCLASAAPRGAGRGGRGPPGSRSRRAAALRGGLRGDGPDERRPPG